MTLDHFDLNWMRAGLAAKNTDQRHPALGLDIDTGEVVKPVGGTFINGEMPGAVGFDDVPERCKGLPRERGGKKLERVQG
jgi:hypothetical protein